MKFQGHMEVYRVKRKRMDARTVSAYVFLIPGLLFFCFSTVIPFINGINIAFTDWNGITKDYNYVWFKNFLTMMKDPRIVQPLGNSLVFAAIGVVGSTVFSLGTAMLVNSVGNRLSKVARTIFFLPVCFSSILSAYIWKFIYKEIVAEFVGRSPLGTSSLVIPAIILVGLWNNSGINMLIYLSGLKSIPKELYESARLDGASKWSLFQNITLPLLTPSFTVCVTLSLTSWLREFATTLALTQGGPGGASRTMSIYIFNNLYQYNKAGYGEAVALVFALCLALIGSSVSGFFRKREVEM